MERKPLAPSGDLVLKAVPLDGQRQSTYDGRALELGHWCWRWYWLSMNDTLVLAGLASCSRRVAPAAPADLSSKVDR